MNKAFLNGICRPWNIHAPSFLALSLRALGDAKGGVSLSEWRDKFSQFVPQRQSMAVDPNGIAHISVHGTLFNKEAPYFVAACGNDKVAQAVAHCGKPVFAYSDGMCCSAAYAIAAGAAYIAASPDSTVGSIGTILPLMDVSGLWEAMGVKPDYITNAEGTLKAAGYPPSQSAEERASLQSETQCFFELFKSHVNTYRDLKKEDMRGQAFVGNSALKAGLVDEICDKNSAYNKLCILTR